MIPDLLLCDRDGGLLESLGHVGMNGEGILTNSTGEERNERLEEDERLLEHGLVALRLVLADGHDDPVDERSVHGRERVGVDLRQDLELGTGKDEDVGENLRETHEMVLLDVSVQEKFKGLEEAKRIRVSG